MDTFLTINLIAFILVVLAALYLFIKAVMTRYSYIQLGQKKEFDLALKDRLRDVLVIVFGQSKLLKDKKSGAIHVMMFYGFILVQFGAIDMFIKGISPDSHLPFGPLYPAFTFFQEIVTLTILVAVVWAVYRRYIEKLVRLKRVWYAGLVLIFIGTLMLSVLFGNGMMQLWQGTGSAWTAPVASAIAMALSFIPETGAMVLFFIKLNAMAIAIATGALSFIPETGTM